MRPLISIASILLSLLVCSMTKESEKLKMSDHFCELIKSTRPLTKFKFLAGNNHEINLKGLSKLDEENYNILNGYELNDSERNYLYGQFKISNTRIGLVCYNMTKECDHDQFSFTLHIIDNCKKAKEPFVLSMSDGDGGILYDISSSLNKTLDTLTIKKETTSEWVVGTNSKNDTLFTDIYKVNLRSNSLDTVVKRSFYKKIKFN